MPITQNLDFLKSIIMLMIGVIGANIMRLYSYVKLRNYWAFIFKTLNNVFNLNLMPCVEIAIFGVPEHGVYLTNNVKNVIAFASLLARRRILVEWKSKNVPKASMWICDLISHLKLEKIKYL